jgi:HAE1 family hydrophobic/amphiphilic exporter-1
MLFGTIFGVIIVPGLYYIFGKMAEGRKLIRDEDNDPLSESVAHRLDSFPQIADSDEQAH